MNKVFQKSISIAALMLAFPAWSQPITVVLKLKERVSMQVLAHNVQDPSSDHYQKFYEPQEIRAIAAASDADYAKIIKGLKSQGFLIVKESPTHLWLTVRAESKTFESNFSTKIKSLGNGLHTNTTLALVPFHLAMVESVVGLDNSRKRFPKFFTKGETTSSPGGVPQATIKKAYGFDSLYKSGLSGQGQHIAIATYDGFHIDMIKTFFQLSKLSPMPSVDQVMFNGTPQFDENSAIETSLDAEFAGMMAPGSAVHVFASAENSDAGELALFTAILDDNRAKIINYSWGSCEVGMEPKHFAEMDKVFARAVAQGVNIMVASGDSGSDSCQDGTAKADWPAANANVVAVGGTTFRQNGDQMTEKAWSGSGGGISGIWTLPDYQAHLGSAYPMRSYPDVSFNSDPASGQAVYAEVNGKAGWLTVGGTSMAAPQWSGFMALIGEARATAGKAPLGFMNPIIYTMSAGTMSSTFNDVSSGSNGAFSSAIGWDAVTGYGSMKAETLLQTFR